MCTFWNIATVRGGQYLKFEIRTVCAILVICLVLSFDLQRRAMARWENIVGSQSVVIFAERNTTSKRMPTSASSLILSPSSSTPANHESHIINCTYNQQRKQISLIILIIITATTTARAKIIWRTLTSLAGGAFGIHFGAVSYTHLTLPTIYSV